MTAPCMSLGSDGLKATIHADHVELSDGQEHVLLTLEEAADLGAFITSQRIRFARQDKP